LRTHFFTVANNKNCVVEKRQSLVACVRAVDTALIINEILSYLNCSEDRTIVKHSLLQAFLTVNEVEA
jgi:hypothetical protein